jgi:hypothetical protein
MASLSGSTQTPNNSDNSDQEQTQEGPSAADLAKFRRLAALYIKYHDKGDQVGCESILIKFLNVIDDMPILM